MAYRGLELVPLSQLGCSETGFLADYKVFLLRFNDAIAVQV